MPVTKSELIEQLSNRAKLPKEKAEQIVGVIFDSMAAALERDDRIEIRGFGSFEVRHYKPYEGRNPRTGAPVHVKQKKLPFFKVGKDLRERINRGPVSESAGSQTGAATAESSGESAAQVRPDGPHIAREPSFHPSSTPRPELDEQPPLQLVNDDGLAAAHDAAPAQQQAPESDPIEFRSTAPSSTSPVSDKPDFEPSSFDTPGIKPPPVDY